MDEPATCIEQPYDDTVNPRAQRKERCRTTAYPVKECAGLLFAYMGPQPVPELPVWEPFTWENGFREVVLSDIPCNWFQCQENSCDPVHFEWMHDNWSTRLQGAERPVCGQAPQARVRGVRATASSTSACAKARRDGDPVWTIGRVTLWPNGFYLGNHFEWRVPIDDENTLSVCWFFMRVPKGREPYVQDNGSDLVQPDQGRQRPLDLQPRHQPGHHRLGRAGHRSPTAPRRTSARATSASR